MQPTSTATDKARSTLNVFGVMILVWSIVWMAKTYLDENIGWFNHESATFGFWLLAKIAVWIVPAFMLIRMSGRDVTSQLNLNQWRLWFFWGTAIGLLLVIIGIVAKVHSGLQLFPNKADYGTLNALIIAPLFEEFLIRAALLGNLIPALGFTRANVVAAICFVVLHIPGWYMMGSLAEKFSQPIGGALSIFFLGLCFGWVTQKGRSFLGGSIAHFFNNLAA